MKRSVLIAAPCISSKIKNLRVIPCTALSHQDYQIRSHSHEDNQYLHVEWGADSLPFSTAVYELQSDADGLSRRSISAGRAVVVEIDYQGSALLLKQYSRGGLIRKFSRNSYIWTGMQRTRAVREVKLLASLYASGLPVPKPVGCRVERVSGTGSGRWRYRAYLVTTLLVDCESLDKVFFDSAGGAGGPEQIQLWENAGLCLARFRRAGVYHADLNLTNILLDTSGQNYLLDFDRCYQMEPDGRRYSSLATRMLTRLLRSVNKYEVKHGQEVSAAAREALVAAYWS